MEFYIKEGQVKIIVKQHFNSILFHKSLSINQSINQSISKPAVHGVMCYGQRKLYASVMMSPAPVRDPS